MKTHGREKGVTLVEMSMAVLAGGLLCSMLVFVVSKQSRQYQDQKVQLALQTQLKKAQQLLTREITNVGAGMPANQYPFTMYTDSLTFSYIDLKAKHCSENEKVTLTYKVIPSGSKKALVRDRKCGTGSSFREVMVACDSADLYFWYMKPDRSSAGTQSQVKMIQYRINLYSRNNKDSFDRKRTGIVTVWLGKT